VGQWTQQELEKEPLHLSSTSAASPPNEESYCLMRELINTYGFYGLIRLHTHTHTHTRTHTHTQKVNGRKVARFERDEGRFGNKFENQVEKLNIQTKSPKLVALSCRVATWPPAISRWRSSPGLTVYVNLWHRDWASPSPREDQLTAYSRWLELLPNTDITLRYRGDRDTTRHL